MWVLAVPGQGVLSLIFIVSGIMDRKLASLAPFPLVTNLSPASSPCSISRGGRTPRVPLSRLPTPRAFSGYRSRRQVLAPLSEIVKDPVAESSLLLVSLFVKEVLKRDQGFLNSGLQDS